MEPTEILESKSKSRPLNLVISGDGNVEHATPLDSCPQTVMATAAADDADNKLLRRRSDEEATRGSAIVGQNLSLEIKVYEKRNKESISVDVVKSPRSSPRFTTAVSALSAKSQRSKSGCFKLNGNKEAEIMNAERINGMNLRRSPRLTSAPPETKVSSPKTSLISSEKKRKSPRFVAETESCGVNGFLRINQDLNSGLSIERQLRRSPKISPATKNGCHDVSIRKLDMDEMSFSMQPTENGDSDVSFKECRREISNGKQLKILPSCSTLLAGGDSAEVNFSSTRLSNSYDEQPSKKFKISSEELDMGTSDEKFSKKDKGPFLSEKKTSKPKTDPIFIGNPIPDDEAQERWRWRYEMKNMKSKRKRISMDDDDDEDKIVWNVECHYAQAEIDECTIDLGDCVYIEGEEAKHHIGRILEFFKTTDGENYFRVQWFYRAEDTVMKQETAFHDERRLFYSTVMIDNPIDCILSKVNVAQISPELGLNTNLLPKSDFYFDMEYCVDYSTFRTLSTDKSFKSCSSSNCYTEVVPTTPAFPENIPGFGTYKAELTLLDLYSGCGGMSTDLCLGAKASHIDLLTVLSSNQ